MIKENHMRSNTFNFLPSRSLVAAQVVALSCDLATLAHAAPQSSQTAAAASQPSQASFATPKQAAEALIQAASNYDVPALMGMFGPDGKDIVSTADAVRDKNNAASFAAEAHEKTDVVVDPKNPNRAILFVGNEEWPLPIPIVKKRRNGTSISRRASGRFCTGASEPMNSTPSQLAAALWKPRRTTQSRSTTTPG
jgi:Protein of unknown function (DUF2950)